MLFQLVTSFVPLSAASPLANSGHYLGILKTGDCDMLGCISQKGAIFLEIGVIDKIKPILLNVPFDRHSRSKGFV